MLNNRTIWVTVRFRGRYIGQAPDGSEEYGGEVQLVVTDSLPLDGYGASAAAAVSPDGTIDFSKWPNTNPARWNDAVDIIFSLDGKCRLSNGTIVPVSWAPDMTNDINGYPVMLLTQMDMVTPFSSPDVSVGWVPGSNNSQIVLTDYTQDQDYRFRPAIIVPALNNYYISCNPPSVKKRTMTTKDWWENHGWWNAWILDLSITVSDGKPPAARDDFVYAVTRMDPDGYWPDVVHPKGQIKPGTWLVSSEYGRSSLSDIGEMNISFELASGSGDGGTVPVRWAPSPTADGGPPVRIFRDDGETVVPPDELVAEWDGPDRRRIIVRWVDPRRGYRFRFGVLVGGDRGLFVTHDCLVSGKDWDPGWYEKPNPWYYEGNQAGGGD